MSKRCKLQKEYYQQYGSYKGNGAYRDEYVKWLENEVLALRQPPVSGSVPLDWSPVESERIWQQEKFKRVFPNYPNDQPDWQRLNFFIHAGLEYLKLGGNDR